MGIQSTYARLGASGERAAGVDDVVQPRHRDRECSHVDAQGEGPFGQACNTNEEKEPNDPDFEHCVELTEQSWSEARESGRCIDAETHSNNSDIAPYRHRR